MRRLPRPRLFVWVLLAALSIALLLSGRGFIGQDSSELLDPRSVNELMEGPSGLEEVRLSEELVRKHTVHLCRHPSREDL